MTHVSRFPVDKDVYFEILDALYWVLADVKRQEEMKQFLGDFFTKTERLMLAKRLALAGMIVKGYDTPTIKRILHVSTGTIYRMKERLDSRGRGFAVGIGRITRKETFDLLIKKLFERLHSTGLHPLADS